MPVGRMHQQSDDQPLCLRRTVLLLILRCLRLLPIRELEPPVTLEALQTTMARVREWVSEHAEFCLPETAIIRPRPVGMDVAHVPLTGFRSIRRPHPTISYSIVSIHASLRRVCRLFFAKPLHHLTINTAFHVRFQTNACHRFDRAQLRRSYCNFRRHVPT